jgi:hypothetical protein
MFHARYEIEKAPNFDLTAYWYVTYRETHLDCYMPEQSSSYEHLILISTPKISDGDLSCNVEINYSCVTAHPTFPP